MVSYLGPAGGHIPILDEIDAVVTVVRSDMYCIVPPKQSWRPWFTILPLLMNASQRPIIGRPWPCHRLGSNPNQPNVKSGSKPTPQHF